MKTPKLAQSPLILTIPPEKESLALFITGSLKLLTISACLLSSSFAFAYELAPNPNHSIININTPDAESHGEPFENFGQVNIESGGKLTNFFEFTVIRGSVNVNTGGTLVNDGAEGVFVVDEVGSLSNSGLIENYGRLKSSWNFSNAFGGTLNNHAGAEFTNTRTTDQRGNVVNAGSFINAAGPFSTTDAYLQNVGNWSNTAGSSWLNNGLTENFGVIDNAGSFINRRGFSGGSSQAKISNRHIINNLAGGEMTNNFRWFNRSGSTLNNSGVFTNDFSSLGISNEVNATINNLAGATFINRTSLNNTGTIMNAGTFDVTATATNLTKGGSYIQTAGTTIVNGTMRTLVMDIQGGTLTGAGTIDADVNIGTAATLMPGNSPGTLNIIGDLDLAGLLDIEITDDILYDIVDINGTATLSGDLNVSFFDLWRPAAGDTFDILTADTINGTFASLNLAALAPGLFWDVRYLLDTTGTDIVQLAVVSSVSAVPLPASIWMFIAGGTVLTAFGRHHKAVQQG